ncbi:hypothetical protein JRC04_15515 [Mycolicibacterium sp. S2-37]|uniref:hypothetical protein n=1 Tax=Mycolicibacterium sp. S2-37 TaxID=2810297 RepID=UPI001A95433D|nr:hypothetical protein [Mycolicibacterium sp. S2-37]MBO0678873.1 hypothetical protein [Mycolicibacterium sp. S2-37]
MALSIGELKGWAPEVEELATATRGAAANHSGAAQFYRSLIGVSTWQGESAAAAHAAMAATAGDHEAAADRLATAAGGMESVQHDAEAVAATIKRILDDAAAPPAVMVDESTNAVIPPETGYLTEEYAAHVAAKVTDLQGRIAAAVADGERLDADLAQAIATAAGVSPPAAPSPSFVEDLLLPRTAGDGRPPQPGERAPGPTSLDGALGELTGTGQPIGPADPRALGAQAPVPLDPAKVDQFKNLARSVLERDGVAPDQIEARLDAMVAAAQRPLPAYKPPPPDKMPAPGFGEGFGDRWRATEQGIKELIGQGGPGAPGVLEAWRDLAKATNDQVSNPVGTVIGEVEHALDSPSAAYYLGEKSADAAAAAPAVVFGGEGALVARAGALDDLAGAGAIPHDVINGPTPSGAIDAVPLAGDHSAALAGEDQPVGYSPQAPAVASSLNEAFTSAQPTTDLAREVANLSTHYVGDADRVVLGKWDGQDGGYIGAARSNGGIYFDTGDATWTAMEGGLSGTDAKALGWQVNEQFLRTQLESRVPRIEYVLPDGFDTVDQVARVRRESFSALEINFLNENAAAYGYRRDGNSWVYGDQ